MNSKKMGKIRNKSEKFGKNQQKPEKNQKNLRILLYEKYLSNFLIIKQDGIIEQDGGFLEN